LGGTNRNKSDLRGDPTSKEASEKALSGGRHRAKGKRKFSTHKDFFGHKGRIPFLAGAIRRRLLVRGKKKGGQEIPLLCFLPNPEKRKPGSPNQSGGDNLGRGGKNSQYSKLKGWEMGSRPTLPLGEGKDFKSCNKKGGESNSRRKILLTLLPTSGKKKTYPLWLQKGHINEYRIRGETGKQALPPQIRRKGGSKQTDF